jgi:hypothetical protein
MGKVSVYLPEELEQAVRAVPEINVSYFCQEAVKTALRELTKCPTGHETLTKKKGRYYCDTCNEKVL